MKTKSRVMAAILAAVLILSIVMTAFAETYDIIPYGERSTAVRRMQSALKKKGYFSGSVDGKFGPATKKAIIRYQTAIGIKADGKPGNRTLNALYNGTSSINEVVNVKVEAMPEVKNPNTLYYGCKGARVLSLQRALKVLGYFKGTVDGVYGDLTLGAVKKFQSAKGLHVDGLAGRQTLSLINNAQKKIKVGTTFLLSDGSRGNEVKELQAKLGQLKYYGGGDEYGVYGEKTKEAIRNYQSANGLKETGNTSQGLYNRIVLAK